MGAVTYTTVDRVRRLIQRSTAFGSTSKPTEETVEQMILSKEDYIDQFTESAFRETYVIDEYHDLRRIRNRNAGYSIDLDHLNVRTFDTSKGDKLEIFLGTEPWDDFISTKNEGRDKDFWMNYTEGILWLRYHAPVSYKQSIRVTYRYGGVDTPLNGSHTDIITTFTLDSTDGFPAKGWFRVNDEEITYTGKTSTTLTGCTRGAFDTTAAAHLDNDIVYWVPGDIVEACTKLAAIDVLQEEKYGSSVPEGDVEGTRIIDDINKWSADVRRILKQRRELVYNSV